MPNNYATRAGGSDYGTEAAGEIGAGPGVTAEAHVGDTNWGSTGFGVPHTPFGAAYGSEGASVPMVTVGESGFVGAGTTVHFFF